MNYKEIAQTILEQLGGSKIVPMIGAQGRLACMKKSAFHDMPALKIGFRAKAPNSIKEVLISYDYNKDTYVVDFLKACNTPKQHLKFIENPNAFVVSSHENVYCDELSNLFEEETGLYLSL